jgi:hypothetical protein
MWGIVCEKVWLEKWPEHFARRYSGWEKVEKTGCGGDDPHRGHG